MEIQFNLAYPKINSRIICYRSCRLSVGGLMPLQGKCVPSSNLMLHICANISTENKEKYEKIIKKRKGSRIIENIERMKTKWSIRRYS
jgi:hypothetical protein